MLELAACHSVWEAGLLLFLSPAGHEKSVDQFLQGSRGKALAAARAAWPLRGEISPWAPSLPSPPEPPRRTGCVGCDRRWENDPTALQMQNWSLISFPWGAALLLPGGSIPGPGVALGGAEDAASLPLALGNGSPGVASRLFPFVCFQRRNCSALPKKMPEKTWDAGCAGVALPGWCQVGLPQTGTVDTQGGIQQTAPVSIAVVGTEGKQSTWSSGVGADLKPSPVASICHAKGVSSPSQRAKGQMGPFHLLFHFPFPAHGPGGANVTSSFIWQNSQKPPPVAFGVENIVFSLTQSCCVLLRCPLARAGDQLKRWTLTGFIYACSSPTARAVHIP